MDAGPPVALALDPAPAAERLAATNGANAGVRLLLRGAALQLRDTHGNATMAAGVRVRLCLRWPGGGAGALSCSCSFCSCLLNLPCLPVGMRKAE